MNKGEILVTIHEMRGECAHGQRNALMRVGNAVIEGDTDKGSIQAYHEAKAKVLILDELFEKIERMPEDTGKPRHNPFCNETIRDAEC